MPEESDKTHQFDKSDVLPKWAGLLVLIAISSFIIESPIKFLLGKIGLGTAIYARDVLALSIPIWMLLRWMTGSKPNTSIIVLFILICHALYGVLIIGSIIQPIIALKVYIYLLLGTALYPTFTTYSNTVKKWACIMLGLTLAGIALDFFIEMPWSGEVFESATGARQISREWSTGGISRISGFARASYDAATFSILLGTTVCILTIKTKLARFLLLIAITIAVILTTSKGAVLSLLFLIPYTILYDERKPNTFPMVLHAAPTLMLTIPLSFHLTNYKAKVGGELWFLLSSFAERINWMWPGAFDLLSTPWITIFGRGLGGIGLPQKFGEGMLYNSADNAMVYLFVSMGFMSIIYIQTILIRLENNKIFTEKGIWSCIISWIIYWIVYGFTTNLFENPIISIFFGIAIGASLIKYSKNI